MEGRYYQDGGLSMGRTLEHGTIEIMGSCKFLSRLMGVVLFQIFSQRCIYQLTHDGNIPLY